MSVSSFVVHRNAIQSMMYKYAKKLPMLTHNETNRPNKEEHYISTPHIFKEACINGNLMVAKWLYETIEDIQLNTEWLLDAFQKASENMNTLDVLKWLYVILKRLVDQSVNDDVKYIITDIAYINSDLNIVKWAYEVVPEAMTDIEHIIRCITLAHDIEIATWLYNVAIMQSPSVFDNLSPEVSNDTKGPTEGLSLIFASFCGALEQKDMVKAEWLYNKFQRSITPMLDTIQIKIEYF